MSDILLNSTEERMAVMSRELTPNDLILSTEQVFYVFPYLEGNHLAHYFEQYAEMLDVFSDRKHWEWRFDIMLDNEAFTSILNWILVAGI